MVTLARSIPEAARAVVDESETRRLTIGVIARNGLPFLKSCLASLPTAHEAVDNVEVILVDCVSSDGTGEVMREFANTRADTRIYRIDGTANAAVARNVILDNAGPGFVLLLDGDVVLSDDFIEAGVERIRAGKSDAVIGKMAELRHDENGVPESAPIWRSTTRQERYVNDTRGATGSILLGPGVRRQKMRYDERFRRGQDRDFAFRLSTTFRLMQVPVKLGMHLTHHYYSPHRISQFYREGYPRFTGLLLRKHAAHPSRIWSLVQREKGPFLGLAYQALLLAALASGHTWVAAAVLVCVGLDALRFFFQGRLREFVPIRIASPWMMLYGLFGPNEPLPENVVRRVV